MALTRHSLSKKYPYCHSEAERSGAEESHAASNGETLRYRLRRELSRTLRATAVAALFLT